MAAPKLTAKQKIFIAEYLRDKNATRAARAAGYSAKTAPRMGSENLSKPLIKKAISAAVDKQIKKIEISADRVLQRIAEFALEKKFIKPGDTLKALEMLAKHFKLLTDVSEVTGKDGGPQVILTMPVNGSEAPKE